MFMVTLSQEKTGFGKEKAKDFLFENWTKVSFFFLSTLNKCIENTLIGSSFCHPKNQKLKFHILLTLGVIIKSPNALRNFLM